MRYMQEGGFQHNPLMRLTLGLTLFLLVAFWVSNTAIYFSKMTLQPRSVVAYYNGSEEEFRPPRSAASMVETTHMHLPMMAVVILLLTHLLIFLPLSRTAKVALIVTAFLSALLQEAAGWLVRFVSPAFAPVKVMGFLCLQASMGCLLALVGLFLLKSARSQARLRAALAQESRADSLHEEGAVHAALE